MATNDRTAGDIKREIEQERNALASSVETLRSEIKEATDVRATTDAADPPEEPPGMRVGS